MAKIPVTKKVKHIRTLAQLWQYRKRLWAMLTDIFSRRYKASFITLVALVAGLVYLISPIDFVPDFIPFIGWVDDGFIVYFLVKRLLVELERYESRKQDLIQL
jgi:uncharacterized membrane protein YkvA (DUF1232 family)